MQLFSFTHDRVRDIALTKCALTKIFLKIKSQNSLQLSETDRNKGWKVTRTDKKDPKNHCICLILVGLCCSGELVKVYETVGDTGNQIN